MTHKPRHGLTHGRRWGDHLGSNVQHIVYATMLACASAAVSGCGSDTMGFDPALNKNQFFSRFALSQHALNLATDPSYNTVQLHTSALLGDGSPIPDAVTFSTSDPAVSVSATGLVTANETVDVPVVVRAELRYGGITRRDSAYVSVIAGSPAAAFETLSIQPPAGDSAVVAARDAMLTGEKQLTVTKRDANGDSVSGLLVEFRSSDTLTAAINSDGVVTGLKPGKVMLYASTFAYGVVKQDSLEFIIGQPLAVIVQSVQRIPTGSRESILVFEPGTIVIGVGGNVAWLNVTTKQIDVVFDDPSTIGGNTVFPEFLDAYPGTGDIPAFGASLDESGSPIFGSGTAVRSFPQAGRYPYHSELYHTTGVIIVCEQRTGTCP